MPLSWNLVTLTSWNHLGHSRPVTGLLYLTPIRDACLLHWPAVLSLGCDVILRDLRRIIWTEIRPLAGVYQYPCSSVNISLLLFFITDYFTSIFLSVTKPCFRLMGVPDASDIFYISTEFSYRFLSSSFLVFQTCSTAWLNHLVPVRLIYLFPVFRYKLDTALRHLYEAVGWRIAEIPCVRLAVMHRSNRAFSRLVRHRRLWRSPLSVHVK